MDSCPFCSAEFEEASFSEYENWSLQIFVDDQYYIGRSVIVLDRHLVDFVDLSKQERTELFESVLPDLTTCLEETFSPDLINYARIGNDCEHMHIHCVPRYETPVMFAGKEFVDEYWGQTYQQDYERVVFSDKKRAKLKQMLAEKL